MEVKMKTLMLALMAISLAAGFALTGHAESGNTTLDTVDPEVALTAPLNGDTWFIGYSNEINWTAADTNLPDQPVQIHYSTNNGASYSSLKESYANTGSYLWLASAPASDSAKVLVKVTDDFGNYASSANTGVFSIKYTPPPEISNVSIAQRTDGSKIVDIYYDLADVNNDPCEISIILSDNGGVSYTISPDSANVSGDIGDGISPGTGKHIVWAAGNEAGDFDDDDYRVRITADDKTYPPNPGNFVYVQGGTFSNTYNNYTNVTVSSFYINQYEVTQSEFQAAMGYNPASGYGVGDNHPVYLLSWNRAVEYCNRLSASESLTPCYSFGSYGTDPDNWPSGWDSVDTLSIHMACNWAANGYRLPTQYESHFAAIGGNLTHGYTYAGSNDPDSVAWYYDNSGLVSHQVGLMQPNELGLYDMTGNMEEYCWDIVNPDYDPSGLTDPRGPVEFYLSSTARTIRGGNYMSSTFNADVRFTWEITPNNSSQPQIGLRLVRSTY